MDAWFNLLQNFWQALQTGQLPHLGAWNYVLLAILVAIEGPIVTLLGSAAAAAGLAQLDLVFLAAAAGNLTADALWYSIGYTGRLERLVRYGRWLGVRPHHVETLKQGMTDHATKLLLLAKLSAGFVIPTLLAAGMARISWRRWFLPIFAAEMVWTGALVLIGYYATQFVSQIEKGIEYLAAAAAILFLLILLGFLQRTMRRRSEYAGSDREDGPSTP